MHRLDTKNEKSQNEYTALALYKWTDKLVDHREILLTDQQPTTTHFPGEISPTFSIYTFK